MNKRFCDKCGKEAVGDCLKIWWSNLGQRNVIGDKSTRPIEYDLCEQCKREIRQALPASGGRDDLWQ